MATAHIIITSFDGQNIRTVQALPNAVAYRVNQVLRSSMDRWTGRGLPPVHLQHVVDGQTVNSHTLRGIHLHPKVMYRSIVLALSAFDAA